MKKALSSLLLLPFLLLPLSLSVCGSDPAPDGTVGLPVLMYHHLVSEGAASEDTVVTEDSFRAQIAALSEAGYTTVTPEDVIAFVEDGVPLPDKPLMITFDDGYTSNLTIAAPILEEYGMCATVFVIGINAGKEVYEHSGQPFWLARFGGDEAAEWIGKGVINVQSHTYDMHQYASDGYSLRDGMLQKEGESEEEYRAALREDLSLALGELWTDFGVQAVALSYPFDYRSAIAEEEVRSAGFLMTFTTQSGLNVIRTGDPDCLFDLCRINVTDRSTGKALVRQLDRLLSRAGY